jgi:hypothetical protein
MVSPLAQVEFVDEVMQIPVAKQAKSETDANVFVRVASVHWRSS